MFYSLLWVGGLKLESLSNVPRLICVTLKRSVWSLAYFVGWWAQVDSNHRPRAYQARALTTWAMSPYVSSVYLVHLSPLVEMMGIEPMTPCLQGRCSPSWATPPYLRYFFLNGHSKLNNSESRTHKLSLVLTSSPFLVLLYLEYNRSDAQHLSVTFSIERRWSSRTFRYGYLVTT